MRIEKIERYKLTLCEGEHDEQIVYANLTNEMVELIKQDIRGELNRECLIALENGELIETGIIDRIEKAPTYNSISNGNTTKTDFKEECKMKNVRPNQLNKCTDCAYCGDKYSFEQPNDLLDIDENNPFIKHYYCNCGDAKYYRQDITGVEIHDCEEFEEV